MPQKNGAREQQPQDIEVIFVRVWRHYAILSVHLDEELLSVGCLHTMRNFRFFD